MDTRRTTIFILLVAAFLILLWQGISWLEHRGDNGVNGQLSDNLFLSVSSSLEEAGSITESANSAWWVNSGAYLYVSTSGIASTIIGPLPDSDRWEALYKKDNAIDTDNGLHPQNIFRLVSRSTWQNYEEQAYFLIKANNLSSSPNRNESNGLLLFNRYQTGQTLYYAGVRVDGAAVIKKKINGVYYTMATKQVFPGTYDHDRTPNLLPQNTWIGLRTDVTTAADGKVTIVLSSDVGKTGNWTTLLTATDDGTQFGGAPITAPGYVGIRTDFMDVQFDAFRVKNISP